jgi:hypothetical protein
MGQRSDQTFKGAVAALVAYVLIQFGADDALVLVVTPVVTGLLAILSTKVGDPEMASFFEGDGHHPAVH